MCTCFFSPRVFVGTYKTKASSAQKIKTNVKKKKERTRSATKEKICLLNQNELLKQYSFLFEVDHIQKLETEIVEHANSYVLQKC